MMAETAFGEPKVEIKYLLPTANPLSVGAIKKQFGLKDSNAQHIDVYFFDTKDLALIRHNFVLRLREEDGEWKATVCKQRPADNRAERKRGRT